MFPSTRRLKTTMGRSLSWHRLMAVASATLSPRASTSDGVSRIESLRLGMRPRIRVVDPVDALRHEDHLGSDLEGSLGGGRVGGEVRQPHARPEDYDASLLQVPHRPAGHVGLRDLAHRDGGLDPGLDPGLLAEVLQGQAVHDGAEHAHVVGPGAIHASVGELGTAEVVAAADDHGHLRSTTDHVGDLRRDRGHDVGVDPERPAAGERLAGELEQDPVPTAFGRLGPRLDDAVQGRLNGAGWRRGRVRESGIQSSLPVRARPTPSSIAARPGRARTGRRRSPWCRTPTSTCATVFLLSTTLGCSRRTVSLK